MNNHEKDDSVMVVAAVALIGAGAAFAQMGGGGVLERAVITAGVITVPMGPSTWRT